MPGGNRCCVATCMSHSIAKSSGEQLLFFTFPKDPKIRKQWIQKCYRKDKVNPQTGRICSKHFLKEDFEDALKAELMNLNPKILKKTSVPSLHLRSENVEDAPPKRRVNKYCENRDRKEIVDKLISTSLLEEEQHQMATCTVFGCDNSQVPNGNDPHIHYYYFPKDPVILELWLKSYLWKAPFGDLNTARICSDHFTPESYSSEYKMLDYTGGYVKMLKPDAIPTLRMQDINNKNIIMYTVPENSDFICTAPANVVISTPETVDEEYNITDTEFAEIKRKNQRLARDIDLRRNRIESLKKTLQHVENEFNGSCEEYKQKIAQIYKMRRQHMSRTAQISALTKVFSESQMRILMGKKRIYWSADDMAVGHTVRLLSSKRFYMHLTKNLNIPMPGLSSIKRWETLKRDEGGDKMNEVLEKNEESD